MRFPTSIRTTSPRLTPRAAKAPERPALRAISSPKCQSRRRPSRSTAITPSFDDGKDSSRSSIRFTGASLPQQPRRLGYSS